MSAPRPLAAAVLAIALVSCGGGSGNDKNTKVTINTPGPGQTGAAPVSLKAALSGADEVPGPGVKDGVGAFLLDITGTKGCYDVKATMGEKPTKAHIHQGAKGASGPVIVDLMRPRGADARPDFSDHMRIRTDYPSQSLKVWVGRDIKADDEHWAEVERQNPGRLIDRLRQRKVDAENAPFPPG